MAHQYHIIQDLAGRPSWAGHFKTENSRSGLRAHSTYYERIESVHLTIYVVYVQLIQPARPVRVIGHGHLLLIVAAKMSHQRKCARCAQRICDP